MAETKQISTITEVTTTVSTVSIYTYYQTAVEAILNFFISLVVNAINTIDFVEGELGFTKDIFPNFDASVNAQGELIVVDTDADVYFIDGVGNLISGIALNAPVATAASNIADSSFVANWGAVAGATKYYLDVAIDAQFNTYVSGYQNLDVGNVLTYNVSGFFTYTNHYYRVRAYDGVQVSLDSNAILIIRSYSNWFLPSIGELSIMLYNLHTLAPPIGNFNADGYWSSTEVIESSSDQVNTMEKAYTYYAAYSRLKSNTSCSTRPCRSFVSMVEYNIRDIGPSGGYIFYKLSLESGSYYYLESYIEDISSTEPWSNITNVACGASGSIVGTGAANTLTVINQEGHVSSAAKLCNDLIV
jgi:hypothetical protein